MFARTDRSWPWWCLSIAAVIAALVGATSALAADSPGKNPGEDTPFLPPGVPVLHVRIDPQGFGYVRNTTPDIYLVDCPLACRRPLASGTSVTLMATPNAGYKVTGWTITDAPSTLTCQGQTSSVCSFTMPGATTGLPASGELEVVAHIAKASSA